MRRRRVPGPIASRAVVAAVLIVTPMLASCGSDDDSDGAAGVSSTAPPAATAATAAGATIGESESDEEDEGEEGEEDEEGESYEIVSDAEVATGLASTIATLTSMSAAPATATADAITEVFDGWYSYEGTIKQNDTASYFDFEDALGAFKKAAESGDQAAMATALADFTTTSSTYLTAHPG